LGPLRQVTGKASDYSEDILRFLMFSTAVEDVEEEKQADGGAIVTKTKTLEVTSEYIEEEVAEWQPEEEIDFQDLADKCEQSQTDSDQKEEPEECKTDEIEKMAVRTAQDALNDCKFLVVYN
jgi:hypothetical protein